MGDQSRETDRGRYALAQALPLLIFTLCALGAASVFAGRNYLQFRRSAAFVDAVGPVCVGLPAPDTSPYEDGEEHPIVMVRQTSDGRFFMDNGPLPSSWQPDAVSDVQLVLCVEVDRRAIRTLCNEAGGDSGLTTPHGREWVVQLRETYTAEIVKSGIISSVPNTPETGCLATRPNESPPDTMPPAQVQAWLQPLVGISADQPSASP